MNDIDVIIDAIKDKSLDDIKEELKELLESGIKDSVAFVNECTANTVRWLTMKVNGQLTRDDVLSLLKSQKKVAQIFVNTQSIEKRVRIVKIAYRILDISIDILTHSI